ncbi:MAG TPA: zinc-ribbon domain-containing protein [Clostridiaceae bacterium]|nr:zinc-ribbon domain-containing protein [Clostridiaceae bacterium]
MDVNNSEKVIYCSKCGKPNYPEANFCSRCGNNLNANFNSEEQSFNSSYQAQQRMYDNYYDNYYGNKNYYDNAPNGYYRIYAGFWKRFAASLIDGIILGLADALIGFVFGKSSGRIDYIISTIIGWLYFSLMESSEKQATLGKMALGIYVTDNYGNRITFGRATGRYFGKIVSALTLCIGYIMAAFTEKKQALHDMMAGCVVLSR